MRRPSSFVFGMMIIILAVAGGEAQVVTLGNDTGVAFAEIDGAEVIQVAVAEIRLQPVTIAGQQWAMVQVPTGHNLMRRGEPALPFLASEFLLGDDDRISLELVSVREHEIDLSSEGYAGVVPSKGHFDRSQNPANIPFEFDSKIYGSDQSYPGVRQWVDGPFISGPLRGQAMRIPVARWSSESNRLLVIKEATFRVIRSSDYENPRTRPQPALTGLFDQMAQLRAVNYAAERTRYTPLVETGRLLILTYDSFLANVQPLADWETKVGYPTLHTALSAVPHSGANPTASEIKAYIQGLYDSGEGLTWIILVGDYQQISNPSGLKEGADCDPCYTKLEGGDNRPDAAISRISAQNPADVDVQIAKILNYEQYPDTGSAATWYESAFGVASSDSGGGLIDWERMNLLRDDLLLYNYSEFTELYSNPSQTAVANAVNSGASLGLYIGHGYTTGWVTSGFDVSAVNSMLTNGSMLPIIWDVACVNGDFGAVDVCFAEAWMRKQGGGAVSFEAATTNENWVPPCDAQRGIIDALRLEVAFTTGGQHVNGKGYCMDVNGDSNSSEGNMFMEQSTLFGSCLTWPRTLAPVAADEPLDYQLGGGQATLTVTTGGQPYTKANGAIVSFYVETETAVNLLGSGLIDSNGVVTAAVSGDPTHCHIHGNNLIPIAYELAARPDGQVTIDQTAYSCAGTVGIRVSDSNVGATTVNVTLATPGGQTTVSLPEDSPGDGFYSADYTLGSAFPVAHGETLTATYHDADIGDGSSQDKNDTAAIDCQGPAISAVTATMTDSSITFSYTTDEPATTVVVYGLATPPATVESDDALVTDHEVTITGVTPCTTFFYAVESADGLGNQSSDDNNGAYYEITSAGWGTFLSDTLDSDPGWTINNGSHPSDGWAFGQPTGQGQDSYGGPDPISGATGDFVYGVNLSGDIAAGLGDNELTLTTPTIDLSDALSVQVRFQRWLGVEKDSYDNARIRLSVDGGQSWSVVWENDNTDIDDQAWTEQTVLLPAAIGESAVQIQWTYGSTDGSWNFCGWNLDDIVVEGAIECTLSDEIFSDDFEGGGHSAWSITVE